MFASIDCKTCAHGTAQAADIDLDKPNAAGFTIRQIVQQQQQQQGQGTQSAIQASSSDDTTSSHSDSGTDSGAEAAATSHHRTTAHTRQASRLPAAAAGAEEHRHLDGTDDWLDKLAYEMSYDDGEGFQWYVLTFLLPDLYPQKCPVVMALLSV